MEDVAVIGTSQTEYRHFYDTVTLPELVFRAAREALSDANLTAADIDAVVYAMAPDALVGVMHAERWIVDGAGATGKPLIRINTGGATGMSAVHAGYDHVASGMFERVLVIGAERVGESGSAQTILNRIWEPLYERPLPLNTITMLAMQGIRFFEKYGASERDMANVSVKNHANGCRNQYAHIRTPVTVDEVLASRPIAHPIKLLDACPQSSGAAAMVLARGDEAERLTDRPVWVRGVGFGSETYWMGDRMGSRAISDHAESPELTTAVDAALAMAGLSPEDVDVAELYAPFSCVELHAIQDARLCKPGEVMQLLEAGYFDIDGQVPVNPSGGVMCANPIAVTAMARAIEIALQLQGAAGDHQVDDAQCGLATGIGGDHQFFSAMVMTTNRPNDRRGVE